MALAQWNADAAVMNSIHPLVLGENRPCNIVTFDDAHRSSASEHIANRRDATVPANSAEAARNGGGAPFPETTANRTVPLDRRWSADDWMSWLTSS